MHANAREVNVTSVSLLDDSWKGAGSLSSLPLFRDSHSPYVSSWPHALIHASISHWILVERHSLSLSQLAQLRKN